MFSCVEILHSYAHTLVALYRVIPEKTYELFNEYAYSKLAIVYYCNSTIHRIGFVG